MPALVPTLASSLTRADATFRLGRTSAARKAYEDLLEHKDELLDMSQATQGWTWMQKILAERKKKT